METYRKPFQSLPYQKSNTFGKFEDHFTMELTDRENLEKDEKNKVSRENTVYAYVVLPPVAALLSAVTRSRERYRLSIYTEYFGFRGDPFADPADLDSFYINPIYQAHTTLS